MSKEPLEHLSSLMDGELSREASLFMTRRLTSDGVLSEKWERYHLVRDCIRQPGGKQLATDLHIRVQASLEEEATPRLSARNGRRWLKPVSGMAVAASVALMAIMVTAPQQGMDPVDETDPGAANQSFVSPNTLPMAPSASQAVSYDDLNTYLLRHNQVARTAGRQGFVSFVPIVATPAEAVANEENEEDTTLDQAVDVTEATERQ